MDGALKIAKEKSSLHSLLCRERGTRSWFRPRLTLTQILAWADEHHERTGRWPTLSSGKVEAAPHESWWQINAALRTGKRGMKGGSSLVRLLAKRRGRSLREPLPSLTVAQIRDWARAYKQKHGAWPN